MTPLFVAALCFCAFEAVLNAFLVLGVTWRYKSYLVSWLVGCTFELTPMVAMVPSAFAKARGKQTSKIQQQS